MEKEKVESDREAVGMVIPPQSSLKLVSHGKPESEGFYYTWEIKVYCDNLDLAFQDVNIMNAKMKKEYGV